MPAAPARRSRALPRAPATAGWRQHLQGPAPAPAARCGQGQRSHGDVGRPVRVPQAVSGPGLGRHPAAQGLGQSVWHGARLPHGWYHHNQYYLMPQSQINLQSMINAFAAEGWGTVALNDASLYWGGATTSRRIGVHRIRHIAMAEKSTSRLPVHKTRCLSPSKTTFMTSFAKARKCIFPSRSFITTCECRTSTYF